MTIITTEMINSARVYANSQTYLRINTLLSISPNDIRIEIHPYNDKYKETISLEYKGNWYCDIELRDNDCLHITNYSLEEIDELNCAMLFTFANCFMNKLEELLKKDL